MEICARHEPGSQETHNCRAEDSEYSLTVPSSPTHIEPSGHCCLEMSKLLTVSHNYTKSVPLLRHTGRWTLLLQNVFLFSSCLHCFLTHFYYENYAALWAEIIWIWSFSSRKEITHGSWSGKLKLWTKSLIFSHCCSLFFFSDSALLFSSCPSDSHWG